jgi:hypothetical protein
MPLSRSSANGCCVRGTTRCDLDKVGQAFFRDGPFTDIAGVPDGAFGDFVKIGVPFTIIVMAAALVLAPWLLPL